MLCCVVLCCVVLCCVARSSLTAFQHGLMGGRDDVGEKTGTSCYNFQL